LDTGWLNCPNCDTRYEDESLKCPTCGADNPLKQKYDTSYFRPATPKSSKTGVTMAAVGGVAAVIGIIILLASQGNLPFGGFLGPSEDLLKDKQLSDSIDREDSDLESASDNDVDSNEAAPALITNTKNVLTDRVLLLPEDFKVYAITIPNEDDVVLSGQVSVFGSGKTNVQLLDKDKNNFCKPVQNCSFVVHGNDSPAAIGKESNGQFKMAVKSGSLVYLRLENIEESINQLVEVNAIVSFTSTETDGMESTMAQSEDKDLIAIDSNVVEEADHEDQEDDGNVNNNSVSETVEETVQESQPTTNTLTEYYQHALDEINKDRAKFGLSPVKLSDNKAAQEHAEDVLSTRKISHWTTDGMKPYMKYTLLGGEGNVAQNVAVSGYLGSDVDSCKDGFYFCPSIDVLEAIEEAEYGMMYDDAASDWGHRDNILDEHHTHVSLGIAYNDYFFVLVQNFEDNYANLDMPVTRDNENIRISGSMITDTEGFEVYGIGVFYDPTPTPSLYERYHDQGYYNQGGLVALIVEPLQHGGYYQQPTDYELIEADVFRQDSDSFDIYFNLAEVIEDYNDGVYTIVTYLALEGDQIGYSQFPITSYSVFISETAG
jgi:uncharacterized protein YkwD